jgi:dihydroneopterin aldolase
MDACVRLSQKAMDHIIINELEVRCRVGVTPEERVQPQRLLLTVELAHDFASAAATDDLRHTIDYFALSQRLLGLGQGREWRLIETLAVEIAQLVLVEFGARSVVVEVKKFVIPQARYVAVRVRRPVERNGTLA